MPKVKTAPDAAAGGSTVTTTVTIPPKVEEAPEKKEKFDFWSYIAALSPAEWSHHTIYLYRTKPIVGMKAKERYLDVFAQPFTVDDIRTRFGGEEFRAMLVREGKIVANQEFAIEAAPKYDASREIPMSSNVGAPTSSGTGEAVTKKVVDQFLDERRQENDMFGEAHRKSLEIVADGYKQAVEAATAAPRTNGATNDGDLVKVLLLKLLDRNPMKEMLEALAMAKQLGLIPEAGGANSVNALTQLKDMVGIVKELGGEMGMGGGKRGGGWAEVIADRAPDLIEKGVEALGKYAEIKARDNENLQIRANAATRLAQINRGGQAQPQPDIPTAMPGGAPRTEVAAVGGVGAEVGGGNAGAGGLDLEPVGGVAPHTPPPPFNPAQATEADAERFLFTWISARVVQMIAAGREGADVIAFVEDCDPRITERLEQSSAEGLRLFFAADPILSNAMKLPRWDTFFAEACAELYESAPGASVKVN